MTTSNPFAQLLDWLEGRLSPEESERLAGTLASADQSAQDDLAWLQRFLEATHSVRVAQPPPPVREALMARFEAFAEGRRPPSIFQRLIASLSFDSGAQWALAGARSAASQGLERQLLYSTERTEIALNVQPRPQGQLVDLTGQIFALDEVQSPFYSVQLLRDQAEVGLVNTDDLGEFVFEGLPVGDYEMIVTGDQFDVVISPIALIT